MRRDDPRRAARLVLTVVLIGLSAGCAAGSVDATTTSAATPTATTTSSPPAADEPRCDEPCYGEPQDAGSVPAGVPGVSGMAASVRSPEVYYVVSDEEGTAEVVAMHGDGEQMARIEIEGMAARNAEALAVGPCAADETPSCLYVADIGDHVGRPNVVVHRAPEPELEPELDDASPTVSAEAVEYTYPDAPTDAEALFVDNHGRVLIISKDESGPARLYRGAPEGGELEFVREFALPEPQFPVFATLVGNVVTDASTNGTDVLIRTYDEVLEYRSPAADADLADFADWPVHRVPTPAQVQAEAVAYQSDGCGYLTAAEGGEIARVDCGR